MSIGEFFRLVVGSPTFPAYLLATAASLVLVASLGCSIFLLKPVARMVAEQKPSVRWALSLGWGLALLFLVWTLVAVTGHTNYFRLVALVIGFVSVALTIASGSFLSKAKTYGLAACYLLPIPWLLALWTSIGSGLSIPGNRLLFNDLHGDLPMHTQLVEWVRESGLPLMDYFSGAPDASGAIGHFGHIVLMAGFGMTTGVDSYLSAAIVWTAAFVLIYVAAFALGERNGVDRTSAILLALAALVWGAFDWSLLGQQGSLQEYLGRESFWIAMSGRNFWNISQALSIAFTLWAVLLLDIYCDATPNSRGATTIFALGVVGLGIGGLTKPSLIIFFGPAMIIWLVLRRARIVEYSIIGVIALACGLLYFMPWSEAIAPQGQGWEVQIDPTQLKAALVFLVKCGCALLVSFVVLAAAGNWRRLVVRPLGLVGIAFFGSIIFTLVFREIVFIGYWATQPNIWWSMAGVSIILVPLVFRELLVVDESRRTALFDAGRGVVLVLAIVHVISGISFAIYYPTHYRRTVGILEAETMAQARSLTSPNVRFAVDPLLFSPDLLPWLTRRTLISTSFSGKESLAQLREWVRFTNTGYAAPRWIPHRLDAVVANTGRTGVNSYFAGLGWARHEVNNRYILWCRLPLSSGSRCGSVGSGASPN